MTVTVAQVMQIRDMKRRHVSMGTICEVMRTLSRDDIAVVMWVMLTRDSFETRDKANEIIAERDSRIERDRLINGQWQPAPRRLTDDWKDS